MCLPNFVSQFVFYQGAKANSVEEVNSYPTCRGRVSKESQDIVPLLWQAFLIPAFYRRVQDTWKKEIMERDAREDVLV